MTFVYSQSDVDVRNDADITGNPAVLITGDHVTLRNSGFLDGNDTGTVVQLSGFGGTFINEGAGNVGSDFFRSTIVGSDHADTIINDGRIRGRVELGGGDDVYIERRSSANAYFGDGNDRFDFIADDRYIDMYNLSLRLDGGTGTDTLNLSGYGLKLSPILRDFEILNVSSTLAYLNGVSGLNTINLAPGGFYEFAFSANPDVDLQLRASLALRGSSSLHSITGSEGQEELRLSGNVRIGAEIDLSAGADFVKVNYGDDAGAPQFGGIVDAGAGADQLTFVNSRDTSLTVDLMQFRGFESIQAQSNGANIVLRGTSDAATIWLSPDAVFDFDLVAAQTSIAAFSGEVRLGAGSIVGAITGPVGHSNIESDDRLSVVNDGLVLGDARLGNGDDTYVASGSVNGIVFGFAGNDTLFGSRASDRFNGGAGDDLIRPGGGRDMVDGGEGIDTLELEGAQSSYSVAQYGDRIVLVHGQDTVEVSGVEQVRFGSANTIAWSEVISATTAFDSLSYIASYADLRQAFGTDAAKGSAHFVASGIGEGRSIVFNPLEYVASFADLRAAFGTDESAATRHYIITGANEGRVTHFDALAYVASYADLRMAFGTDETAAAGHFIRWGAAEGRQTTFDAYGYLAANPMILQTVGATTDAAATHYITIGADRGLATSGFTALQYTASYADLIQAFGTDAAAATRHYVQWGAAEQRSVTFDALAYAAANPDVQAAYGLNEEALAGHYIQWGYAEGRSTGVSVGAFATAADGSSGYELAIASADMFSNWQAGLDLRV